jgi:hypothetical protein
MSLGMSQGTIFFGWKYLMKSWQKAKKVIKLFFFNSDAATK